jgi:hypothetical protein
VTDIPVLVETLWRSFFPMVRCFYLAVEFDTPSNQWWLGLERQQFPFLMLGLTGVVQAPLGASRFYEPNIIDEFIDSVEDADGLVLFEDIWFPKELFRDGVSEGDVYRVGTDLFRQAFSYRDGRTLEEEFQFAARELHRQMSFSEEESIAFRSWSTRTIENARREGPKDANLRLERKRER